jgi:hypothetical protein
MSRAAETTPARFLAIAEGGFLGRQLSMLEREGFVGFFRDIADPTDPATHQYDWADGYILARQVVFAQGALEAADTDWRPIANPYSPGSTAAEVWTQGYNANAQAALDIED